jgi:hypothetical protein
MVQVKLDRIAALGVKVGVADLECLASAVRSVGE